MENIFVEFLPPWVETGIQPAFYDKESGTVLQQTARMYARVNMLIRMFNKLSKNTKETVEEYINKFNELHDYVQDYFDNLDVQEEINNKLDAMAEDGTLESILLNYSTVAKIYHTTRDLIEDAGNLVDGENVKTLGYYTMDDGGDAEFIISDSTSSDYYIDLGNGLYAVLVGKEINVDKLGANAGDKALSYYFDSLEDAQKVYPNATDLAEKIGGVAIQCAINFYHDYVINFGSKTYYKNTLITNDSYNSIYLRGSAKWKTIIKETDTSESVNNMILLNSTSRRSTIENIELIGPYTQTDESQATLESYNTNGIMLDNTSYNKIKDCVFRLLRNGIELQDSWTNTFEECYFARNNNGIDCHTHSNVNDIEINHCFAEYNNTGFNMGEGRSQLILNCDVEKNNLNGVFKHNEGDIQIISSYFEDDINIEYGTTYVRNVLIQGCAFYQDSTNDDFYNFINYNGLANKTKITIQSCNFIDGNENSTGVAIKEKNNSGNLHPILIENTTTNLKEFIIDRFKGIHINNGVVNNYSFNSYNTNFIYGSDGGSKTLAINGINSYRVDLFPSGTYSLVFPSVPENEMCCDHIIKFVVPGYNTSASNGQYSLVPDNASTCNVSGHTTIDKNDIGKEITATLVAYKNGRSYWNISISA